MEGSYRESCKLRSKNVRNKQSSSWFIKGLFNGINEKHRLFRLSRNSLYYKAQYIENKVTLRKCIYHAKKSHYSDKLKQAQSDPQGTWKIISNI